MCIGVLWCGCWRLQLLLFCCCCCCVAKEKMLSMCGQQCIMNCQEHIHKILCLCRDPKKGKRRDSVILKNTTQGIYYHYSFLLIFARPATNYEYYGFCEFENKRPVTVIILSGIVF